MTLGRGKRSASGGLTPPFSPEREATTLRAPAAASPRRPGQRERPATGSRLRSGSALGLGLRLVLGREDGVLALAGEQALELVLVDRLALDQDLRDAVQVVEVLAEHARRELVAVLDDAADLVVDLARDLVRVVGLVAHLAAEERHVVVAAEHARAELLAHPEAHHHLLRGRA